METFFRRMSDQGFDEKGSVLRDKSEHDILDTQLVTCALGFRNFRASVRSKAGCVTEALSAADLAEEYITGFLSGGTLP